MKNRIASLILVFAMLLSLCASAGAADHRITVQSGGAERFTDVPTSHWAYGYINKVVGSGLFNGKTPTTFEPSSAMTRSQFVMVMARMEGHSDLEGVETVTRFPDVTTTRRAAGPIKWATDEGIVQGFGDGTFKPDSPITRGQFAALIHRYIVAKRYVDLYEVDPEPAQFTDAASVTNAFKEDVEYARVHGLLTGYSDGTVRASNPITRAAIAAILARFIDLVIESGYTPFLDGPTDSGDSGDTTTPPVDVTANYDEIKIKVSGETHGSTPTVSVTRDGAVVNTGDVKAGDRVTVRYQPEKGYIAKVRVRDANGKVVTVKKIDANSSWFTMPEAMPVTVTVTYSKESSGGGGGGGSPGGGNDNYSGGGTPSYIMTVNASAAAYNDGRLRFLKDNAPTAATTFASLQTELSFNIPRTDTATTNTLTFYAVLIPNENYHVSACAAADASNANISATEGPTAVTLNGGESAVYYKFDVECTVNQAKTITVTPTFEADTTPGPGPEPPTPNTVNITTATAWDSSVISEITGDADYNAPNFAVADIAQSVSVKATAEAGETVAVTVPHFVGNAVSSETGYFRYELTDVKFTGTAAQSISKSSMMRDTDATWVYDLKIDPNAAQNANITVTAYYKVNADEDLTYNFNVTMSGGKAGDTNTVSVATIGEPNPLDFTASGAKSVTLSRKAYVKNYPAKDDANDATCPLPYSVTATAGLNSKLDSVNPEQSEVNSGATANITARFEEKPVAYGYKLTVIGAGTSTVTFDGKDMPPVQGFANKNGTYSSGLVYGVENKTLTLKNTPTPGSGYVNMDGSASTVTLQQPLNTDGTLTEVTVVFRDENAIPVLFAVDVEGTGSVNMTAENGAIMTKAEGDGKSDLKSALTDATIGYGADTVSGKHSDSGKNVYYAMSGTIITLSKNDAAISKITVTNNDRDISDKPGYSFKLNKVTPTTATTYAAVATVTLAEPTGYSVLASVPVKAEWATPAGGASIFTYSEQLKDAQTLKEVLYTLNDNDGTVNQFAPGLIGGFLLTYLNEAQKASLEETLNKTMSTVLDEKLDDIVGARKTEALQTINATVDEKLGDKKDSTIEIPIVIANASDPRDPAKAFLDLALGNNAAYQANPQDFLALTTITVKVQSGTQNVKQQLLDALNAYTADSNMKVGKGNMSTAISLDIDANNDKLTVKATISGKPTLTFGANNSASGNFSQFLNNLDIFASVSADIYQRGGSGSDTYELDGATYYKVNGLSYTNDNLSYTTYFDAFVKANAEKRDVTAPDVNLAQIKSDMTTGSDSVDNKVKAEWDKATANLTSVDMSEVLSAALLDSVVDKMLDEFAITLVNKIKSLPQDPPAPETKKAVKQLYYGLAKFDDATKTIVLKTTEADKTVTIGEIQNGNLVVTLDMNAILNDANRDNKTTFEQFLTLFTNFRNAVATDIENNGKNQTAESVVSDMISGRVNAASKSGTLTVKKWGSTYSVKGDEAKEVADLLAAMLLSDIDKTTMEKAWKDFEAHGFQCVAFSVNLGGGKVTNALKDAGVNVTDSLLNGQVRAGFKVEQTFPES